MTKVALPAPTRRAMLTGLAGGVAAVGLARISAGSGRAEQMRGRRGYAGKRLPLAQASFEQWASEIGSIFYAGTESGALALKLIAVAALPIVGARPAGLRRKPFEVTFEPVGTATIPAGDRLYPLRHARHGDFHLFFSFSGKALKAIFN